MPIGISRTIAVTHSASSDDMDTIRRFGLVGSAALGVPRLLRRSKAAATVLLSHRYFSGSEAKSRSIDRLRGQLEWLQGAYKPISVSTLINGLAKGDVLNDSIVVTTDDALCDVYEVCEEFRNFGVPLAIFACVGWVGSQAFVENDALIQAVNAIQWYEGPDARITLGGKFNCDLVPSKKSENIDWILNERELLLPHLEELYFEIAALTERPRPRAVCTWSELHQLASVGVYIGAHSVSHVPISQMSAVRRDFEIRESKRVIEAQFGSCTAFAYPFGMRGTYSDSTLAELKAAGFQAAFLTHSDVITESSSIFELPRITLPDTPLPLIEFKARVRGGGIPFRRLKEFALSKAGLMDTLDFHPETPSV